MKSIIILRFKCTALLSNKNEKDNGKYDDGLVFFS